MACHQRGESLRHSREGWLLVGLIILVSAVILALAGVTFYLTEHLRSTSLRQNQTKAIYLAQAGVMQALYDFRRGAGITLRGYNVDNPPGPAPGPNDDAFLLGGKQADYLLAYMPLGKFSNQNPCGGGSKGHRLDAWTLYNVLAGTTLAITQVKAEWSPKDDTNERFARIDLMGKNQVWFSCPGAASGTTVTLSAPVIIGAGVLDNRGHIWFNTTAPPPTWTQKTSVTITFYMEDGSSRTVTYLPQSAMSSSARFTIKAVGEVREGAFPFVTWRRLRAEYLTCAKVTDPTKCNSATEQQQQPGAIVGYEEVAGRTP